MSLPGNSRPQAGSPRVELAGGEDRVAIAHLNVWAFREYAFDLGPEAWPELVARLTAAGDGEADLLVIRGEGGLVGSVAYRPAGSSASPLPAGWASIDLLAVSPAARSQGLGRQLVQACMERASSQGAATIGARVDTFMTAAQGLFSSLGFHREQGLARRDAPAFWLYRKDL